MKKTLLIGLIMAVLLISGCFFDAEEEKNIEPADQKIDESTVKTTENLNYVNDELGFKIDFPEKYLGYRSNIIDNFFTYHIPVFKTVQFGLETSDRNWPTFGRHAEIFRILVYKRADWQEFLNSGLPLPKLLETTDTYVFAYYEKSSFPEDLQITSTDIDSILNTFQVTKWEVTAPVEMKQSTETPQGDD